MADDGAGRSRGRACRHLALRWWLRCKASARLRWPVKWPLGARGLVSTDERDVWKWLRHTFHEHAVLVKVPVLRFTTPLDKEKGKANSERWRALLN